MQAASFFIVQNQKGRSLLMKVTVENMTIEGTPEEISTFMLLKARDKSLVESLNEEQCYQIGIDKAVDN